MELKKNPKQDIHRKSGMFFQIGLGISIALMITAFEWRTPVEKVRPKFIDTVDDPIALIPVTELELKEPPTPSADKNENILPKSLTNISPETTPSSTPVDEPRFVIDQTLLSSVKVIFEIDSIEQCVDCWTSFPEKHAEPIGGYEAFYTFVKKNLKYPQRARKSETEGRVFVEFIVNRDGTPTDFKIIKGIGGGCDEEATRVISLTKWNPGKQRGKPVRVKMVLPIIYRLN